MKVPILTCVISLAAALAAAQTAPQPAAALPVARQSPAPAAPKPAAAQPAAKPAPTPKLTGFPFQNESLRYSINWPSGLSLGEVILSARRAESNWLLNASIDAGVPGFAIADHMESEATAGLCSTEFTRDLSHAARKSKETTTFDSGKLSAHRVTLIPASGGSSDFDIPSCPRDALALLYFARQEMGQGRVAPPSDAYFGSVYSVQLRYTGEMTIPVNGKQVVTDRVVATVKGPKSDIDAEVYFARDAARTPLVIKLPLSLGTFSLELVR